MKSGKDWPAGYPGGIHCSGKVPIKWLEEQFGRPVKTVRCMPNTPAMIGAGITGVAPGETGSRKKRPRSFSVFSLPLWEKPEIVPEPPHGRGGFRQRLLSPPMSSCIIEAMCRCGGGDGMPESQAYHFAAQAVLGSGGYGAQELKTGRHPGELKDRVCSPDGNHQSRALSVLEG